MGPNQTVVPTLPRQSRRATLAQAPYASTSAAASAASSTHARSSVRVDRVGGLCSPRRSELRTAGRDRTSLIAGIERQIAHVQTALSGLGEDPLDVRGALCFPNVDGLPLFKHLTVREILIDGPKKIADLARRPGPLHAEAIERIWRHLHNAFPPA